MTQSNVSTPILAVADTHGHLQQFDALVRWADAHLGRFTLVPLGDYCDNGPQIPGLIQRLIELRAERGPLVQPILGNHDLACLRALEDEGWYARWEQRYWNGKPMGTPHQYGARDAASFRARFPAEHRDFLRSLPWALDLDGFLFVHAGLHLGPIDPQLGPLARKALPEERFHLPAPLRDKGLTQNADPAWDRVVVSSHEKRLPEPAFVGPNRICLKANVENDGVLFAVILPLGRFLRVTPDGEVSELETRTGWRRLGLPAGLKPARPLPAADRAVFPLRAPRGVAPRFISMQRALVQGQARVLDSGTVAMLTIENRGPLPILCLDGELVKGGFQDRVLDRPAWIPAGAAKSVKVSCVEQGRWNTSSGAGFEAAGSFADPALRHARMESREDQGRTWEIVGERRRAAGMADLGGSLVEAQAPREARVRGRIPPAPADAAGLVVARHKTASTSRFPLVVYLADPAALADAWGPLLSSAVGDEALPPPAIPPGDVAELLRKLDEPEEVEVVERDGAVQVLRIRRTSMWGWAVKVGGALVYAGAVRP